MLRGLVGVSPTFVLQPPGSWGVFRIILDQPFFYCIIDEREGEDLKWRGEKARERVIKKQFLLAETVFLVLSSRENQKKIKRHGSAGTLQQDGRFSGTDSRE